MRALLFFESAQSVQWMTFERDGQYSVVLAAARGEMALVESKVVQRTGKRCGNRVRVRKPLPASGQGEMRTESFPLGLFADVAHQCAALLMQFRQ